MVLNNNYLEMLVFGYSEMHVVGSIQIITNRFSIFRSKTKDSSSIPKQLCN